MSRALPRLLWLYVVLAGTCVLFPSLASGQETHFDTFFCIDVSASMVGTGDGGDFLNVFEEVRERVIEDIGSRRVGDTVFLLAFSGPPVELIPGGNGRTVQSQTDRDWLVEKVQELEAIGTTTYLYYTYLEVLEKAQRWHSEHPGHIIDIRVYTDGKNIGPPVPSFEDVLEKIRLVKGDVEHLTVFHIPFIQPGETDAVKMAMREEAEQIEEAGGSLGSVSDLFVRVAPQHLDFGNMRSTNGKRPFSLVVYFDAAARNRTFSCEPTISSITCVPPHQQLDLLLNVHPRPVAIGDQAIRQTIEIVTSGQELPEAASISFHGELVLTPDEQGINFSPPTIGFEARYAPVRAVSMFMDGHAEARRRDSSVLVSTRDAPLFTNEAPQPRYLTFGVVDADLLQVNEEIVLDVVVRDPELRGHEVAAFVRDLEDTGEGSTTASITRDTEVLFLRVRYPAECLRAITTPGYYPVELMVTPRGEDLGLDVGVLGEPDVPTLGTNLIRVFPGPVPSDANWDRYEDDRGAVPPDPCVKLPPPLWLKWVCALVIGAIVFVLLRFLYLPKSSSGVLAVAYILISGVWGAWPGVLALPPSGCWVFWGWVAVTVLHVLLPWPFAFVPFLGGWALDITGSLRKEALKRGRKSLGDHLSRSSLTFGRHREGRDEDDIDISAGSTQFRLTCNRFLPWCKMEILAIAEGIAVDGQRLGSGEATRIGHHSDIETRSKTLMVL